MTVYKNMAFALELRKTPKDEIDRKVREAAHILELDEYLSRKPKELSGGQRQRVALGRAMVRDPAVFLLDEPLSNLDAKLRTEMRSQISALHKRLQTTFVYVTHDQTEAMTMGCLLYTSCSRSDGCKLGRRCIRIRRRMGYRVRSGERTVKQAGILFHSNVKCKMKSKGRARDLPAPFLCKRRIPSEGFLY